MNIKCGDLVDFGGYGKLYVCDHNFLEGHYWVTDNKSDRANQFASGWSIRKHLAKSIVERYESEDNEYTFGLDDNCDYTLDNDYDDWSDEELANIYGGDRNYCPECGSNRYHDGHCYDCEEDEMFGESVTPEYFNTNFEEIYSKYLSDSPENHAEQAIESTLILIKSWYSDGNVFDNTKFISGGINDFSAHANWLYNNIEETQEVLDSIENVYSDGEYEELLQALANIVFNEDLLTRLSEIELAYDVCEEEGKFNFVMSDIVDDTNSEEEMSFDDCDVDFDIFADEEEIELPKLEESKTIHDLKSELETEIINIMTGPKFGFEKDEVFDYTTVEVTKTKEYTKAEVRAELSYNGLTKLADELNKIIEKYDSNAYFDMEEPGIMSAYIFKDIQENLIREALVNVTELEDAIKQEIIVTLTTDFFDFEEDKVFDNIVKLNIEEDSDFMYIEISSDELSSFGMSQLQDNLNKVVEKFDKYANFDCQDILDANTIRAVIRK